VKTESAVANIAWPVSCASTASGRYCFDNAVAESFFSSLKKERIRRRIYQSREEARADVFEYIEIFHNRTHRHSHIGQVGPNDFERTASNQA